MGIAADSQAGIGPPLLHDGFLRSARRQADLPALRIGERTWSYEQAAEEVDRLTGALASVGADRGRVAVLGRRSASSYFGALAALAAGGAFVPLDPTAPAGRLRETLRCADVAAVVADDEGVARLAELSIAAPAILPTRDAPPTGAGAALTRRELRPGRVAAPRRARSASEPAYLLFTSGSTGAPKGVPISHANARSFLDANARRYELDPDDRVSQVSEQTFDLSIFDMFMAWDAGACLCAPLPHELLAPQAFIDRHRITTWLSVPSIGSLLMRRRRGLQPRSLPSLRWSLFCGEALPRRVAAAWQAAAPNSVVENLYGPTELTVACAAYRWDPASDEDDEAAGAVPIGCLYPHLSGIVVDRELCVAGPQLFSGYWRDPAATARATFTTVDATGIERRYYRTGDLVRITDRGEYVFAGRVDDQLKVLGHRVEPGEIEAALLAQDGVTQAAVLGWPPREHGTADFLVAFASGTELAPDELLTRLRRRLPDYMIPRTVIVLDALPVGTRGKVDRARLAELACAAAGYSSASSQGRCV